MRAAAAGVSTLGLLLTVGCSSPSQDVADARPTPRPGDCAAVVSALLTTGEQYLASLVAEPAPAAAGSGVDPGATPSPVATPTSEDPEASDAAVAGERFQQALADLPQYAVGIGCDREQVQRDVVSGLRGLPTGGPVAAAVQARLAVEVGGTRPVSSPLQAGDDVAAAVAAADDGGTVRLGPGRFELTDTLVLLRGVTLEGAGPDATVLSAAGASGTVLVLTGDAVTVRGVGLERTGPTPSSVLAAGTGTSLTLDRVRASGAVADPEGGDGVGVLLTGGPAGQTATTRRTTLTMTDSVLTGNGSAGLLVDGDHRVDVARVVASGNADCGICFLGESDGVVTDADLADNGAGFVVGGRAVPALRGGRVTRGEVGVQVLDEGRPELDGLTVRGAARAALVWGGSATGAVRRTTCADVPFGIVVGPTAAPELEANDCQVARGQ